jgi:hypothetical protein
MTPPETRYAKSGDVHIAYQVVGNGPLDLVWVYGAAGNIELQWAFGSILLRTDRELIYPAVPSISPKVPPPPAILCYSPLRRP